jgi:H+-transporting ATPase
MTGDAPALKQAEVGVAVSNATDVAKGAASAVLTCEGLAGIVKLITVGRQIHHRIATWVLNKTARTLHTTGFIVLSLFATGQFVVDAFDMILMLFLFDFVTLSLATDNVRALGKPTRWDVYRLAGSAAVLGLWIIGLQFAWLYLCAYLTVSTDPDIHTIGFQLVFYFSCLTTFSVRERTRFWASRPVRPPRAHPPNRTTAQR